MRTQKFQKSTLQSGRGKSKKINTSASNTWKKKNEMHWTCPIYWQKIGYQVGIALTYLSGKCEDKHQSDDHSRCDGATDPCKTRSICSHGLSIALSGSGRWWRGGAGSSRIIESYVCCQVYPHVDICNQGSSEWIWSLGHRWTNIGQTSVMCGCFQRTDW